MATSTTYLDEFMDRMYLVPNDVNRYLRLIRSLDKRAQVIQISLNQIQGKFLSQIKQYKQSNSNKRSSSSLINQIPANLRLQYEKIIQKQKQIYGYYRQKYQVSSQLRVLVKQYYDQLEQQIKSKLKDKTQQQKQLFLNRKKILTGKLLPVNGQISGNIIEQKGNITANNKNSILTNLTNLIKTQFFYDNKQPTYCYCGRGSFGEMVMCENIYCEKQWFHIQCIEQKNLPEKWFCLECQKQKQKTRNPISRGYFINNNNRDN